MDETISEGTRVRTSHVRAFGGGVVIVWALVVVTGCAMIRPPSNTASQQHTQVSTTYSTTDWQVYHDPLSMFSVRLPPGWTATAGTNAYTQGTRSGSDSGQEEDVHFSDPALGNASAAIIVHAIPIHDNPVALQFGCGWRSQETSTFNGYPADESEHATVLFESGDAHFQISKWIPGVLGPAHTEPDNAPPPPTPQPLATVAAAREILDATLATFQPTDPKPLVCP